MFFCVVVFLCFVCSSWYRSKKNWHPALAKCNLLSFLHIAKIILTHCDAIDMRKLERWFRFWATHEKWTNFFRAEVKLEKLRKNSLKGAGNLIWKGTGQTGAVFLLNDNSYCHQGVKSNQGLCQREKKQKFKKWTLWKVYEWSHTTHPPIPPWSKPSLKAVEGNDDSSQQILGLSHKFLKDISVWFNDTDPITNFVTDQKCDVRVVAHSCNVCLV